MSASRSAALLVFQKLDPCKYAISCLRIQVGFPPEQAGFFVNGIKKWL
jgi:hypothetical protein